jgi:hypothetical protein
MNAGMHGRLPYADVPLPWDADTVLTFNSFSGDTFQGKPVGVRSLADPGRFVFFGFPLYYTREDEARPLAIKVLTDFGELYGIAESQQLTAYSSQPIPTVVRNVLDLGAYGKQRTAFRADLLNAAGRRVMNLRPGANDVRSLAPGVYFVTVNGLRNTVHTRKVIVTR